MTKLNSNPIGRSDARVTRGFTLVELLVVITILTVIAAILIPRIRVINEDRNIREAARIVASAFVKASARAVNDGSAGLMIVPNPNFVGSTSFTDDGVSYAGTRIFQMRRLPPYIGDDDTSVAMVSETSVTISPAPFETGIIQSNDEISFNGSSYRFRILTATGGVLTLDATGSAPIPPFTTGVPFVIHRQPRRLESSLVELPEGYLIDLRYSGPSGSPFGTFAGSFVELHFDANGGVAELFDVNGNRVQPTGSLDWLVTNFDPNAVAPKAADPTATEPTSREDDPIFRPTNKWVTVDHVTGSVNVASAAVPSSGVADLATAISESREIAVNRQSAGQ